MASRLGLNSLVEKFIDIQNEVEHLRKKVKELEKNSHPPQEFICTTCGNLAKKVDAD